MKVIHEEHCQGCGSTDPEYIDAFNEELEGYTGCCGELIIEGDECDEFCYHA